MEQTIFSNANPAPEANWTDADYEAAIDGLLAKMKLIAAEMESSEQHIQFMREENHALLENIKRMQAAWPAC